MSFRAPASEGLVEITPNRGTAIRKLSRHEILDLFEIRTALECLAAGKAAKRVVAGVSTEDFAQSNQWLTGERHAKERAAFMDENHRFHESIVKLSGNEKLLDHLRDVQQPLAMIQVFHAYETKAFDEAAHEHRQIFTAICAGREKEAVNLMASHLTRASSRIAMLPDQVFKVS